MQLKFQVTLEPRSDDAIIAKVKNIIPQAENIRVINRNEKAALVGFFVNPTSLQSIREAYAGASALQVGKYIDACPYCRDVPFVVRAGDDLLQGYFNHFGATIYHGSDGYVSEEEAINKFAESQAKRIEQLEAKVERISYSNMVLLAEKRRIEAELREEKRKAYSLQETLDKIKPQIWYPIRNPRQLEAVNRKMGR